MMAASQLSVRNTTTQVTADLSTGGETEDETRAEPEVESKEEPEAEVEAGSDPEPATMPEAYDCG